MQQEKNQHALEEYKKTFTQIGSQYKKEFYHVNSSPDTVCSSDDKIFINNATTTHLASHVK